MAARNPDPARITDALWRLWTEFDAHEPDVLLGGIVAEKPGYHSWRDRLPTSDYSRRDLAADRRGPGDKASAIDLTMHNPVKMMLYTSRLDLAVRSGDPRVYSPAGPVLREFIGTKNGTSVYCYVLAGGKPLGVVDGNGQPADAGPDPGRDDSHLWHIHLSIIREFCDNWPALDGVLSVLRGESLAAWRARTEVDMLPDERKMLIAVNERVHALTAMLPTVTSVWSGSDPTGVEQVKAVQYLQSLGDGQAAIATALVQLRALLEEHAAGQLDAEAVVARMGELLSAATPRA